MAARSDAPLADAALLRPLTRSSRPCCAVALNAPTARKLPPADLYWVHASPSCPRWPCAPAALAVPFIYDAHDFYSDSIEQPGPQLGRRWGMLCARPVVERAFVPLAAERLTVGDGMRELQDAHFGRPFEVLHNAHDHRLDRARGRRRPRAAGLGDDAFLRRRRRKLQDRAPRSTPIFDALAALPEHVHLAFVGRNYAEATRLARERGLDDRVHFLAPVPPAEVKSFIAGADAAAILYFPITPNFLNALPNRLYQAIAAGLPLLYPEPIARSARCASSTTWACRSIRATPIRWRRHRAPAR